MDIGEQRGFWGVGLLLMTDLIRTWDKVALARDERVAVARGFRHIRILSEVRGIASVVGNAKGVWVVVY